MTDSNTVEISGIEFDIDSLETAIEEVQDSAGNAQGTVYQNEDVTVVGDSYNDADVTIARTEDVVHVDSQSGNLGVESGADKKFINIGRIEGYIEDARTVPFTEYLEDSSYLYSSNTITEEDGTVDHVVHVDEDSILRGSEVRGLVEDDNVMVEDIDTENGYVRVIVSDLR